MNKDIQELIDTIEQFGFQVSAIGNLKTDGYSFKLKHPTDLTETKEWQALKRKYQDAEGQQ